VFPDDLWSPALAPEEADETTPVAVTEVTSVAVEVAMVERIRVTEHFLAFEYIPVRPAERRARPRMAEAIA